MRQEDGEESLLLDPPDPVDLLLASAEDGACSQKGRSLDFVRAKLTDLKSENKRLKDRVADLEQTLSIVQTAQEWAGGKGMSPEQVEKMKEIKALLEQAKRAREDIQKFSSASRQGLYEKLRNTQNALRREKEQKAEMKERLMHAFHHARVFKEHHRVYAESQASERVKWERIIKDMKERQRRELRRLQGDGAVMAVDRQEQLSNFGEHVMRELTTLQEHLKEVRHETVDTIAPDNDDEDMQGVHPPAFLLDFEDEGYIPPQGDGDEFGDPGPEGTTGSVSFYRGPDETF